ncbi:hypothetical protein P7C71_g4621, partial [Lecanoromycetidae sp. Uapishka_2]
MSQTAGGLIDFSKNSLYLSALAIAFNPLFWNVVARSGTPPSHSLLTSKQPLTATLEYHNKTLTRLANGNSLRGCYALAITIFSLGLIRDSLYERMLRQQPYVSSFHNPYLAYALLAIGNTLVLTSYYALGITGTFLGDYFGILMDEPVTGFPFNVTGAPMYWGSTMSFLGTALLYGRPAGVLVTGEVFLVYLAALQFEDPFTSEIYAKREREKGNGKKGQ